MVDILTFHILFLLQRLLLPDLTCAHINGNHSNSTSLHYDEQRTKFGLKFWVQ